MKKCSVGLFALGVLASCASPGIVYDAPVLPSSEAAAAIRNVSVDDFSGPAGFWYRGEFERMLSAAEFDGRPWFRVSTSRTSPMRVAGTYSGVITIADHQVREYIHTSSKCVEWDGLFDCERRIEIDELCFDETVRVNVRPRLIDARTRQVVFSKSYRSSASDRTCHDLPWRASDYGYRSRDEHDEYHGDRHDRVRRANDRYNYTHRYGGHHYRGPSDHVVRSALRQTLRRVRNDIAPYHRRVRAAFLMTDADPMVAADAKFVRAAEVARSDGHASCPIWQALAVDYPASVSAAHNSGVCAEVVSDFQQARAAYRRSFDLAQSSALEADDMLRVTESLQRLSENEIGHRTILDLVGQTEKQPSDKNL